MNARTVEVPPAFGARAGRSASWATWLEGLPRLVGDILAEWELAPDGATLHGECALVVPVRTAEARAAALKVSWPHWEAETEHVALQRWHGDGAVELLRADPHRFALLLERVSTTDLTTIPIDDATTVIARVYRRLHVPAPPQLRTLSSCVRGWSRRLTELPRDAPVPRRFVEQAAALGRTLADDPVTDGTLIHTDLHYSNVLAAAREPWLVIDPKPLSGDPAFEVAPLLWNRWDEAVATGDLRAALRRRPHQHERHRCEHRGRKQRGRPPTHDVRRQVRRDHAIQTPHGLGVRIHRAAPQSSRTRGAIIGSTTPHQTRTVPVPAAVEVTSGAGSPLPGLAPSSSRARPAGSGPTPTSVCAAAGPRSRPPSGSPGRRSTTYATRRLGSSSPRAPTSRPCRSSSGTPRPR